MAVAEALNKDIYQAFEDVVGPENISDDPAVLDSYAFRFGGASTRPVCTEVCRRGAAQGHG